MSETHWVHNLCSRINFSLQHLHLLSGIVTLWSWIPKALEWSLISLSSPSVSYQLPGTVEPWFQVSILTASILMNRFHHLIPGFFFSCWALCFLSSPFNPPTILCPPSPPNLRVTPNDLTKTRYLSQVVIALFHLGHILYVKNLPHHKPGVSSLFLSCPYLKRLGIPPRFGSPSPSHSLPYLHQLIPSSLCSLIVFIIDSP